MVPYILSFRYLIVLYILLLLFSMVLAHMMLSIGDMCQYGIQLPLASFWVFILVSLWTWSYTISTSYIPYNLTTYIILGGSSISQLPIGHHTSGRPSIITLGQGQGQGRHSVTTLQSHGQPSIVSMSHGRTSLGSLSLQQSVTPPSTPGYPPSTPGSISIVSSPFTEPNTPNMFNNVAYHILPRQFRFVEH